MRLTRVVHDLAVHVVVDLLAIQIATARRTGARVAMGARLVKVGAGDGAGVGAWVAVR